MIGLFTSILITPSKGWENARSIETKKEVILKFALPLVLTAGLCAFCGVLLKAGEFDWQAGLKSFISLSITLFASFYISAIIIKGCSNWLLSKHLLFTEALQFTIFAYSCVIFVYMVGELFEDMFFIKILDLYTFYLVFEGCNKYLGIVEKSGDKRNAFIILSSLVIMVMPGFVRKLLILLMPGLN